MDNTPLLEATGLVRHYGRHPGVADIDLALDGAASLRAAQGLAVRW